MQPRRLAALSPAERTTLLDRDADTADIEPKVRGILERVREQGDAALVALAEEFDGVEIDAIDVTDRVEPVADRVDPELRAAIAEAAANLRAFHDRQRRANWRDSFDGRELGRRFTPIARTGVYVPGGRAAYPSSALMGVIPAKIAGVDHVAVATPPREELHPATMAALDEAGADRVYAVGGAQAIAALAYGTESVDPVDKVVGPGNRWVTAAKGLVRGEVAIDFLAGPSELLVLADETAEARFVAADLIAQAEHDPAARGLALTPSTDLAEAIVTEIDRQIDRRDRSSTIRTAMESDACGVFVVRSMDDAVSFAEAYGPEHLSIQADNDEALLEAVPSAGSAFLGPYTPVAAGDYATGTNHVLPTNGGARVVGGLSVDTFVRSTTVQRLDRGALADLRRTVTTLARAEGLEAHAASLETRFEGPSD